MSYYHRSIKQKILPVILGLGTNGLAVARALGSKKIECIIVEERKNQNQPHLKTKYGKKQIIESLIGPALRDFLLELDKQVLLYPTTDKQVWWISKNSGWLPENVTILFPENRVIQTLLDKENFFHFCNENNIAVPPFFVVSSGDEIDLKIRKLRLPLILKTPTKTYVKGLSKAYIVDSYEQFFELWEKVRKLYKKFIVQEFIPGSDSTVYFCLQYINKNGVLLASFTGRKIRQWKPLCGGTASCEPVEVPFLRQYTYNVFRRAGFSGIGSMEYKLDKRDGKFYVVEPTVCRTDFQEAIAVINGVNIPYIAYRDACNLPVKPRLKSAGSKAWMHVMHDRLAAEYYIKSGHLTRWQWFCSLKNVRAFDLFSFDDPLPIFSYFLNKFTR